MQRFQVELPVRGRKYCDYGPLIQVLAVTLAGIRRGGETRNAEFDLIADG